MGEVVVGLCGCWMSRMTVQITAKSQVCTIRDCKCSRGDDPYVTQQYSGVESTRFLPKLLLIFFSERDSIKKNVGLALRKLFVVCISDQRLYLLTRRVSHAAVLEYPILCNPLRGSVMAAEVLVDEGLGYECFPMRIRKYHGCAAMVSDQIWRGL